MEPPPLSVKGLLRKQFKEAAQPSAIAAPSSQSLHPALASGPSYAFEGSGSERMERAPDPRDGTSGASPSARSGHSWHSGCLGQSLGPSNPTVELRCPTILSSQLSAVDLVGVLFETTV